MRFIHIADVHLGATPDLNMPWGEKRKAELWQSFSRVIDLAEQEKVDLLLIAGDLFHRQPLLRDCKEVNYYFSKLTKTKVVFIAGNHDYVKEGSFYKKFTWNDNVFPLLSDVCESVDFPELDTTIYGLSYPHYEITKPLYDTLQPDWTKRMHILLAHGGDEKHIPINKRELADSAFDYIALGHIHKPEIITENKMAYAGALEPISCNETGAHGYLIGEITKTTKRVQFVPFALRSYKTIQICTSKKETSASLNDQIRDCMAKQGLEHIYRVEITGFHDPDIEYDFSGIESFGNVLEVMDLSEPEYDYEKLKKAYEHSILGRYIERMKKPDSSETERYALQYGVKALLDEMR